jgi:Skp family chaperone for outer membrane proteins
VSDTPRTDEQINGEPCTRFEILAGDCLRNAAVPSEFARTLERELNAANAEIERLTNKVAQLYEGAEEAKQRIQRLEEALEARASDNELNQAWELYIKAKEAKP